MPGSRILGVDYGRRRIGLAVSDELGLTAQGLPTIEATGRSRAVAAVADVARAYSVSEIVVGLPLNMDGSHGELAEAATVFSTQLAESTGIGTRCWDERLTSVTAHRVMRETGTRLRGRKGKVDRIAATVLLDSYLRYLSHSDGPNV